MEQKESHSEAGQHFIRTADRRSPAEAARRTAPALSGGPERGPGAPPGALLVTFPAKEK